MPVVEQRRSLYRELVLDAAEHEFARVGFADTKMAAIAKAADVSLATVYKTFAGKREIWNELHAERMTALLALVDERTPAPPHRWSACSPASLPSRSSSRRTTPTSSSASAPARAGSAPAATDVQRTVWGSGPRHDRRRGRRSRSGRRAGRPPPADRRRPGRLGAPGLARRLGRVRARPSARESSSPTWSPTCGSSSPRCPASGREADVQRHVLPLVDRGRHLGELLPGRGEHVAAEQQPQRRVVQHRPASPPPRRPCRVAGQVVGEGPDQLLAGAHVLGVRRERGRVSCIDRLAQSVRKAPGSTAVTLMPSGPTSLLSASVSASSANFVDE